MSRSAWFKYALGRTFDGVADKRPVFPRLEPHRKAPQPIEMLDDFACGIGERAVSISHMLQLERTVAVAIVANDLHIGHARFMCMLLRKELAQAAIAGLVVDRIDDE